MSITNSGHAISEAVKVGHFSRDQAVTVRQIIRLAIAEERHSEAPRYPKGDMVKLRNERLDLLKFLDKEILGIPTEKGGNK